MPGFGMNFDECKNWTIAKFIPALFQGAAVYRY
jgi:hypothetical protein